MRSRSSGTPAAAIASVSTVSNTCASTPSTTRPNSSVKRRVASQANASSPIAISPGTVASVAPRSSTVSIIPGMEIAAPDRTDSSNGADGSPSRRPVAASSSASAASTCASSSFGTSPAARNSRQAAVVTTKPGGTGSPIRAISARFAPFPPSRSRIDASPSAKCITHRVAGPVDTEGAVVDDMRAPKRLWSGM